MQLQKSKFSLSDKRLQSELQPFDRYVPSIFNKHAPLKKKIKRQSCTFYEYGISKKKIVSGLC